MRTLPSIVVGFALLFLGSVALAGNSSIQGTVIGTDGKYLAGAEIRAERLDSSSRTGAMAAVLTKTDAKGQYVLKDLPVGAYAITAIVKNVPRSRATIKTLSGGARVNFDLRLAANNKNMQPAKSSANPANSSDTDNLSRMQGRMGGNINSMSFPGHG